MDTTATRLSKLRAQRDRLVIDEEDRQAAKTLGPELEKLRQEIRDLGEEPCC